MNTRTNVDSDNLAYSELDAWIAAGCPTADLNCPGPDKDDIIFRLRHKASLMYGEVPELLEEAAVEIFNLRHKLKPQVNNPAPVFVWPVVISAPTPYGTPVAFPVSYEPVVRPPCSTCGVPYEKHGTYPTCASHAYTSLTMQLTGSVDSAGFSFPVSWNHSYNPRS